MENSLIHSIAHLIEEELIAILAIAIILGSLIGYSLAASTTPLLSPTRAVISAADDSN